MRNDEEGRRTSRPGYAPALSAQATPDPRTAERPRHARAEHRGHGRRFHYRRGSPASFVAGQVARPALHPWRAGENHRSESVVLFARLLRAPAGLGSSVREPRRLFDSRLLWRESERRRHHGASARRACVWKLLRRPRSWRQHWQAPLYPSPWWWNRWPGQRAMPGRARLKPTSN
jgi:hypothetical protein